MVEKTDSQCRALCSLQGCVGLYQEEHGPSKQRGIYM